MSPYDTAAALATATARLADALDDDPGNWHLDDPADRHRAYVRVLLDLLGTDHTTDDPHTAAIITRAIDAPWFTIIEDYNDRGEFARYCVAAAPDGWTDPREPSIELCSFLQSARLDVLTLAAEVRRLRLLLTTWPAPGGTCQDCPRCGASPCGGLCPDCTAISDANQPF